MKTDKPEVVAYRYTASRSFGKRNRKWHYQESFPHASNREVAEIGQFEELIRLSDYQRLQADHERLQAEGDKLRKDAERYRSLLEAVQGDPVGYVSPHLLKSLRSGKACGITMADKPDAHNGVTIPLYAMPCKECGGDGAGGEHEDDCAMAQPEQPECGCCGRTDRCDDDCDAVVIGGHRAAEQQPAPDVTGLVEALEAALMVMTSQEVRLEKRADAITMVRSQLATYRKQGGNNE